MDLDATDSVFVEGVVADGEDGRVDLRSFLLLVRDGRMRWRDRVSLRLSLGWEDFDSDWWSVLEMRVTLDMRGGALEADEAEVDAC